MKDFIKNYSSTTRKKVSLTVVSEKNGEKSGFHQPENQLSTSKNEIFLWKLFSNNGVFQQQNSCDKKNTVSTNQKFRLHKLDEGCRKILFHFSEKLFTLS